MRHREVVFRCSCWQCWDCGRHSISLMPNRKTYVNEAGNPDFKREDIPCCHYCGRPAIKDGRYFNLKHTKFCKKTAKQPQDIPAVELLKLALRGIIEIDIDILEKMKKRGVFFARVSKSQLKQMRGHDEVDVRVKLHR